MSLCLHCNLFTVKGTPINENKYVSIFVMWLSAAFQYGGLCASDQIYLTIDANTFEYLKTYTAFCGLMNMNRTCPVQLSLYPSPSTLREGMAMRYKKLKYTQDVYMYCDIDILIIKPLRPLYESLPANTIGVHAEGLLSDDNYGAALSAEEKAMIPAVFPGFSSGKFIVRGKELYDQLMDIILMLHAHHVSSYYTIDQPYFNKAVYILVKDPNQLSVIPPTSISPNGHFFSEECILLDSMGIPGDGEVHYHKMLGYYILLQSNVLEPTLLRKNLKTYELHYNVAN